MSTLRSALIAMVFLPIAIAIASPADDENVRLRAQLEQLKAQLDTAKSSCVAATSQPAVVPSTPLPVNSATVTLPSPQAPVVAAASAPAVPTPAPLAKADVPAGYKLVKVEPIIPKDNRWKDRNNWDSLFKGMSKDEVEGLLGAEHSTTAGGNRTFWGYAKVGTNYGGRVIFVDDRLTVWTTPDL